MIDKEIIITLALATAICIFVILFTLPIINLLSKLV